MFSPALLRRLTLAAALAPAFYLSGCGGGGGGGGGTGPSVPNPTPVTPPVTPGETPVPTPVPTNPGNGSSQLLFDDFSSGTLDSSVWGNYVYPPDDLQRTRFGNRPANLNEGGTSFTRLTLDAYNPGNTDDGRVSFFRGTEIFSRQTYTVGNGLEAEARLRGPDLPPGVVFAFFLIARPRFVGSPPSIDTYRKDEIDFEFVTAQQEQFGGRNRLYTNVWNDWNQIRDRFDGNPNPEDTPDRMRDDLVYRPSVAPNYDYANWNTYKIRWYPDRTEFYVNDNLERTEREVRPNQPMEVHFNFWSPTGDFSQAFSGNLPGPVASPDNPARRIYNFDVDYVRVTALGSGAGIARVASDTEAGTTSSTSYRTR